MIERPSRGGGPAVLSSGTLFQVSAGAGAFQAWANLGMAIIEAWPWSGCETG